MSVVQNAAAYYLYIIAVFHRWDTFLIHTNCIIFQIISGYISGLFFIGKAIYGLSLGSNR